MAKFSIITVCLNEEHSIRKTCESICSQSFDDFEWIVIDGQSTDSTLRILSEYEASIASLISEPDKGIYDAMNKGVLQAKGEYLLFLNAGDYLFDSSVLETVSHLPQEDILYGDLKCASEGEISFIRTFPEVLSRHFLLRNMMPHQASFIRRTLFQNYGGYDISFEIAGDYDLFVKFLYVHKASYSHIPETISVFKTDGISSELSQRSLRKEENHRVRKKYFPWFVYGLKGLRMELKLWFCSMGK